MLFSLCILMVPPSPVFFSSCILMRAIDNTHSPDTVISNTCRARVATLGLQRARRWYAATKAACKYSSYNLLMIISFRFFKRLNTISNTCRARVATLGLQRARRWYAATKAACKYSSYNLLMIISFRFFKRLNTIRKQTGEQLTEY